MQADLHKRINLLKCIQNLLYQMLLNPHRFIFSLMTYNWMNKSEALRSGKITQDEYDAWKYHYPTPGQTTHSHIEAVSTPE